MPELLDPIVQLVLNHFLPAPRPDSLWQVLSAPEYAMWFLIRLAVTLLPPLFACVFLIRRLLGSGGTEEGIPRNDDSPIPRRTDD